MAPRRRPKDIAPSLFEISLKNKRIVHDALHNDNWLHDLDVRGHITNNLLYAFVELWSLLQAVQLRLHQKDSIIWKLTTSGSYSAAFAYKAQFLGCTKMPPISSIWKSWAPLSGNFSCGSLPRIVCGPMISSATQGGRTTTLASSADGVWKQPTTY
jgi:hypothetical protein